MKRLSILLLLCGVFLPAALARPPKPTPVSPVFINDQPLVPPTVPPQVDALTFINQSIFVVSNDFLFIPFRPTPYEAQSVVNWNNNGTMIGLPGFNFENTPNPAHMTSAQRRRRGALLTKPSALFENTGEISVSDWLRINANHIVNPGVLSGDINARFKIFANNGFADLSRGAVRIGDLPQPDCSSVSNLFFGFFFFNNDPEVIEDYNFINFGISGVVLSNALHTPVPLFLPNLALQFAPPNPVPPPAEYAVSVAVFPGGLATNRQTNVQFSLNSCGLYDSFVHVRTNFAGTNVLGRDVSVVFVPTNGLSTNISLGVAFPTNGFNGFFFGTAPIVEFRADTFDVIEQRHKTNFLTFRDDGNTVFRAHDCEFDVSDPANATLTPDLFYTTSFETNAVNYNYTVANLHIGNTNSFYFTNNPASQFFLFPELGRSAAASDPTNFPGNVEVAANDLDLSHARIRAENGILIHATNLIGNESAFLDAPFVSFDAGTTNQNLVISNLIATQVTRLQANLNSWAADWVVGVTNGGTFITVVDTNSPTGLTNIFFPTIERWTYHVLILGACVNGSSPTITHRFALHGTNIVIEDNLAINASLLLDGQSLTIGSNASITLPRAASAAFTNFQNLVNFTNNGVLNVPYGAYFGAFEDGYVPPPLPKKKKGKKLKGPQPPQLIPYENIVNHGTIAASTMKARAAYIEDTGTMFSPALIFGSNGPVSLNGATLIISNAVIQAQSDIRLTAGDLLATHSTLLATNSGSFRNFIPGALILDVTNSISDGGVTASNLWRVSGGVRMVRRPFGSFETGEVGDLMGTRIESLASTFVRAEFTWAGEDRGVSVEGFTNNLALGRLVLDGALGNQFRFRSATGSNALYVDYLELRNDATNTASGRIQIDPDFTLYFADSNISPEKLDEIPGGRIRWVSDFAGPQSSTNILYPNGVTYTLNAGLAVSQVIDSDNDGFVNYQDCTPIIPPGLEDQREFWFGQLCPPTPSPLHAVRAAALGTQDLNLQIALMPEERQVILNWDAPANSSNHVEFTESLASGAWQTLTNFINGPVNARVMVRDAADAPQRVYRVRVDAGTP